MNFSDYFLNEDECLDEKRSSGVLDAENKIIKFLNSPKAEEYMSDKSNLVYKLTPEVMQELGVTDKDARALEITSTGQEKFLALSSRNGISLYLKAEPKYLRF